MTRYMEMPALDRRAAISSWDAEQRTASLVFSSGAAVERRDWFSGERYLEILSLDPKHVRLERLNSGAPLLDSHAGYSVRQMLGAVVAGSARVAGGQATATVKFSARPDVAPVVQDVKDGVIRAVSVGYLVHQFTETAATKTSLATRTATDWEPYELSLVPMPADIGAHVRSQDLPRSHCRITGACDDRGRALALARLRHAAPLDGGRGRRPTRGTWTPPAAFAHDEDGLSVLERLQMWNAGLITEHPFARDTAVQESDPGHRSPSAGPSAAQLRAVGDAVAAYTGQVAHGFGMFPPHPTPEFRIAWDSEDADLAARFAAEDRHDSYARGLCYLGADGVVIIGLRVTEPPETLGETTIHELVHATQMLEGRTLTTWHGDRESEAVALGQFYAPVLRRRLEAHA